MKPGRKLIIETIKPILKLEGFFKEGTTWRKSMGKITCVFNVQGSPYSDCAIFNRGVFIHQYGKKHNPYEYECHIRSHVDSLLRNMPDMPDILDFENGMVWEERVEHILKLVQDQALAWFNQMSTKTGMLKFVKMKNNRSMISPVVYKYLKTKPPVIKPRKRRIRVHLFELPKDFDPSVPEDVKMLDAAFKKVVTRKRSQQ